MLQKGLDSLTKFLENVDEFRQDLMMLRDSNPNQKRLNRFKREIELFCSEVNKISDRVLKKKDELKRLRAFLKIKNTGEYRSLQVQLAELYSQTRSKDDVIQELKEELDQMRKKPSNKQVTMSLNNSYNLLRKKSKFAQKEGIQDATENSSNSSKIKDIILDGSYLQESNESSFEKHARRNQSRPSSVPLNKRSRIVSSNNLSSKKSKVHERFFEDQQVSNKVLATLEEEVDLDESIQVPPGQDLFDSESNSRCSIAKMNVERVVQPARVLVDIVEADTEFISLEKSHVGRMIRGVESQTKVNETFVQVQQSETSTVLKLLDLESFEGVNLPFTRIDKIDQELQTTKIDFMERGTETRCLSQLLEVDCYRGLNVPRKSIEKIDSEFQTDINLEERGIVTDSAQEFLEMGSYQGVKIPIYEIQRQDQQSETQKILVGEKRSNPQQFKDVLKVDNYRGVSLPIFKVEKTDQGLQVGGNPSEVLLETVSFEGPSLPLIEVVQQDQKFQTEVDQLNKETSTKDNGIAKETSSTLEVESFEGLKVPVKEVGRVDQQEQVSMVVDSKEFATNTKQRATNLQVEEIKGLTLPKKIIKYADQEQQIFISPSQDTKSSETLSMIDSMEVQTYKGQNIPLVTVPKSDQQQQVSVSRQSQGSETQSKKILLQVQQIVGENIPFKVVERVVKVLQTEIRLENKGSETQSESLRLKAIEYEGVSIPRNELQTQDSSFQVEPIIDTKESETSSRLEFLNTDLLKCVTVLNKKPEISVLNITTETTKIDTQDKSIQKIMAPAPPKKRVDLTKLESHLSKINLSSKISLTQIKSSKSGASSLNAQIDKIRQLQKTINQRRQRNQ